MPSFSLAVEVLSVLLLSGVSSESALVRFAMVNPHCFTEADELITIGNARQWAELGLEE